MDTYKVLRQYFGYDKFRQGQEDLINAVLNGRDGLGIMPTGGGKSLCYQLPALIFKGVTLVVSPLISLMKDQVDSLDQMGIPAVYLNSSLSLEEFNKRLERIKNMDYKLVYVAPERLNDPYFIRLINQVEVSMLAIDEAHCISQWGHDFRPSYREIPNFINSLEKRPVISAYTATATSLVTEEIINLLGLNNPFKSIIGFDRPNLFYSVVKVGNKLDYLDRFIKNDYPNKSGIIYCSTRKNVESLTSQLTSLGHKVLGYHGGMSPVKRGKAQDLFIHDKVDIIVATNAFGMGIDKPDVRFVVHYNMPQNMESYYQEAGRAGRDGEPGYCLLMYSPGDIVQQKFLIQTQTLNSKRETLLYENLQYLIDYCHTNTCLRRQILEYFDETPGFNQCGNCGNCLDESESIDITIESQKILSCIYRMEERYGINMVIQVLRGSKNKKVLENKLNKLSTYGIMKEYSNEGIREIIMNLISRDYIYMTASRFPILKLTSKSREVLNGQVRVYHKKDLVASLDKKSTNSPNLKFNQELFDRLKSLRSRLANDNKLAPFMVFHDSSLKEMAEVLPTSKEEFLKIKGVGLKKFQTYGKDFLDLIEAYLKSNNPVKTPNNNESLEERYLTTYNLYKQGLNLEEIGEKRGYTISTIINHLGKVRDMGYPIDFSRFINKDREDIILDKINQLGSSPIKAIKDSLGDDFSYEEINLTIIKNKVNKE